MEAVAEDSSHGERVAVLRCHFGNGGTAGDGCSGTSGLDSKPNMAGWGGVGPRIAT